jgi:hypothetical protein
MLASTNKALSVVQSLLNCRIDLRPPPLPDHDSANDSIASDDDQVGQRDHSVQAADLPVIE